MDEKIARKAAKWWADFLRNGAPLENGDDSPIGGITAVLALLLQKSESSNGAEDDAQRFEDALTDVIVEQGQAKWFSIGCDYGPDGNLSEAAARANVNLGMTRLPWKTNMWIHEGKVTYSLGYRGETQELV